MESPLEAGGCPGPAPSKSRGHLAACAKGLVENGTGVRQSLSPVESATLSIGLGANPRRRSTRSTRRSPKTDSRTCEGQLVRERGLVRDHVQVDVAAPLRVVHPRPEQRDVAVDAEHLAGAPLDRTHFVLRQPHRSM